MTPPTVSVRFVFLATIVCVYANLAGCANTNFGQSPGNMRLQSGPESPWRKGTNSLELNSAPAPTNTEDNKRGNTPPGKDRAGGDPGSGAIVDPAGVLTK